LQETSTSHSGLLAPSSPAPDFGLKLAITLVTNIGKAMKTLISLCITAFLLTSCYVETIEPRYDSRDAIVGDYEAEEYSETYDDFTYYSFRIVKSSYIDEIYFNNFYGVDIRIHAIIDYDQITIPFQVKDGYEVEGTGTIYGDEIRLNYYVKDQYSNTRRDYCETVAWRE
jgi:hypothetical protein